MTIKSLGKDAKNNCQPSTHARYLEHRPADSVLHMYRLESPPALAMYFPLEDMTFADTQRGSPNKWKASNKAPHVDGEGKGSMEAVSPDEILLVSGSIDGRLWPWIRSAAWPATRGWGTKLQWGASICLPMSWALGIASGSRDLHKTAPYGGKTRLTVDRPLISISSLDSNHPITSVKGSHLMGSGSSFFSHTYAELPLSFP
jgi:hypothetical protein